MTGAEILVTIAVAMATAWAIIYCAAVAGPDAYWEPDEDDDGDYGEEYR